MKTLKKFQAILLTAVMTLCGFSTTAFADESTAIREDNSVDLTATEESEVFEFELTSDDEDDDGTVTIDQIFGMVSTHKGLDRIYDTNSLSFSIMITDPQGNPLDNQVSIQLKDYNSNIQYFTAYADGGWYCYNVSITPGTYYFFYQNLGVYRTLKVRMIIQY